MTKEIRIITPRLILRPASVEAAPEVQAAKEDMWPELQIWLEWAHDDQKPLAPMLEHIAANPPLTLLWAFRRDNGRFAVTNGLRDLGDGVYYLTGYWCARDQLGQGFATEATNAVIRYAFGALKAKAVTIDYCEGNAKSARVIQKLGFTPARVRPGFHTRCTDGALLDQHEFVRIGTDGLPELEVSWT